MRRSLLIICTATVLSLVAAPAALATTQTASAGNVTATFTFSGTYPNFTGLQLSIAQGSTVLYDEPVVSKLCGMFCAPGSPSGPGTSVHVLDLEHDGQPDVCSISTAAAPTAARSSRSSRSIRAR